jgi:hypothetical protein
MADAVSLNTVQRGKAYDGPRKQQIARPRGFVAPPWIAAALVMAVSVAGGPAPAQADPFIPTLPILVSGPSTIVEGTLNNQYTFAITNNTVNNLTVDFALAVIQYDSGDATDQIIFGPGAPGHMNNVAPGAVVDFVYDVRAPGVPDGTKDFGVYSIKFWTEWSTISFDMVPEDIDRAQANLLVHGDGGTFDPVVNQALNDCVSFPVRCSGPPGFLYPPSLNPGIHTFGGQAGIMVTISDIPEPPGLALITVAILALIGFGWRNRRGL